MSVPAIGVIGHARRRIAEQVHRAPNAVLVAEAADAAHRALAQLVDDAIDDVLAEVVQASIGGVQGDGVVRRGRARTQPQHPRVGFGKGPVIAARRIRIRSRQDIKWVQRVKLSLQSGIAYIHKRGPTVRERIATPWTALFLEGNIEGDRVGEQTLELVLGGDDAGFKGRGAARFVGIDEDKSAAGRAYGHTAAGRAGRRARRRRSRRPGLPPPGRSRRAMTLTRRAAGRRRGMRRSRMTKRSLRKRAPRWRKTRAPTQKRLRARLGAKEPRSSNPPRRPVPNWSRNRTKADRHFDRTSRLGRIMGRPDR